MSYAEPDASGYTPHPSELSPKDFAVRPSDSTQDLCFRSIKAINRAALQPSGNVPERRTPKGIRPAVYTMYNASQTAIIFEVMLHTGQTVQCHVPADSWRLATCDPENVRAAIQKAYLFFLQGKKDPVVVRPGMMSLGLIPFAEHQRSKSLGTHGLGHGHGHGSRHTTTRYYTPAARHESYQSYSSDSTALTYTIPQYSNPTSPAGQAVGVPLQYNNYSGAYTVQYVPGVAVQPPQQKLKKRWWTLQ